MKMGFWSRVKLAASVLFSSDPAGTTIVSVDDDGDSAVPDELAGYQTLQVWLTGRKRTVQITGRGPMPGMLVVKTVDSMADHSLYMGLLQEWQVDPADVEKFRRLAGVI